MTFTIFTSLFHFTAKLSKYKLQILILYDRIYLCFRYNSSKANLCIFKHLSQEYEVFEDEADKIRAELAERAKKQAIIDFEDAVRMNAIKNINFIS